MKKIVVAGGLLIAASIVVIWAISYGGSVLASRFAPTPPPVPTAVSWLSKLYQPVEEIAVGGECTEYGRISEDPATGQVILCEDGYWLVAVSECEYVVDEDRTVYERVDPYPEGAVPEACRFSNWAGDAYWDEQLQAEVRLACYFAGEVGCDIRYKIKP
ncbi:MAG: hypothetical protein BMS9Abin34_453 [Patescibacteria group bacterium]|nr:MAG: hypothetical protein BMS9Abin34_453 [Patescibacteria group bacterium]